MRNADRTWTKMETKKNVIGFLTGRARKRDHGIFLIVVGIVVAAILILCGSLYFQPFTFRTACPSNLGNPNLNPRGWVLFSILMIAYGALLVPHALYLHRKIFPVTKGLTNSMLVFTLLGCAGMTGVGIFNETFGAIHYVFAGFAFGGFGIATFLFMIILTRKKILEKRKGFKAWAGIIILYGIILSFVALMFREFAIFGFDAPWELYLAEWYAFFAILTWVFGAIFLLPTKDDSNA